jgi:hypothetical protein
MALTATPNQAGGYVLLEGTSLGVVTETTVVRIDAAGNEVVVRNGDPLAVSGGSATTQDYEAPLDTIVSYEMRNTGTSAVITSTSGVILPSLTNLAWLSHPGKPAFNVTFTPRSFIPATRRSRSATYDVIGRTLPVAQSLRRAGEEGTLIVKITTNEQRLALHTLLDDGAVLLLRGPQGWPTMGSRYIQVGDADYEPLIRVLTDERAWLTLPWVEVDRPAGLAQAGPGFTWGDVITAYGSWSALISDNGTWADVIDGVD